MEQLYVYLILTLISVSLSFYFYICAKAGENGKTASLKEAMKKDDFVSNVLLWPFESVLYAIMMLIFDLILYSIFRSKSVLTKSHHHKALISGSGVLLMFGIITFLGFLREISHY